MAKKEFKYSQAITELQEIVDGLRDENIDVDELSHKVKRATELIGICRDKIEKTEMEVKNILKKFEEEKDEKD